MNDCNVAENNGRKKFMIEKKYYSYLKFLFFFSVGWGLGNITQNNFYIIFFLIGYWKFCYNKFFLFINIKIFILYIYIITLSLHINPKFNFVVNCKQIFYVTDVVRLSL